MFFLVILPRQTPHEGGVRLAPVRLEVEKTCEARCAPCQREVRLGVSFAPALLPGQLPAPAPHQHTVTNQKLSLAAAPLDNIPVSVLYFGCISKRKLQRKPDGSSKNVSLKIEFSINNILVISIHFLDYCCWCRTIKNAAQFDDEPS